MVVLHAPASSWCRFLDGRPRNEGVRSGPVLSMATSTCRTVTPPSRDPLGGSHNAADRGHPRCRVVESDGSQRIRKGGGTGLCDGLRPARPPFQCHCRNVRRSSALCLFPSFRAACKLPHTLSTGFPAFPERGRARTEARELSRGGAVRKAGDVGLTRPMHARWSAKRLPGCFVSQRLNTNLVARCTQYSTTQHKHSTLPLTAKNTHHHSLPRASVDDDEDHGRARVRTSC